MEEDIKIIKASKIMSDDIPHSEHSKRLRKALENLIKGYRELEEENRELREIKLVASYFINRPHSQFSIGEFRYKVSNYQDDFISKSKIKEKINAYSKSCAVVDAFIVDVLQELMEDK